MLPAAIELVAPPPRVDSVDPAIGDAAGGTFLQVRGAGFRFGCTVVIGDRIYREGVDATRVTSSLLTLTTQVTLPGLHDVTVIDRSGPQGRRVRVFNAGVTPVVLSVFPRTGNASGGTHVVLSGASLYVSSLAKTS